MKTTDTLGRTDPSRIDARIDSAWRCVSRAHGRGGPDGEEVHERGDHPRPLELVRCADDKVGYQKRAIVACALCDEREDDDGDWMQKWMMRVFSGELSTVVKKLTTVQRIWRGRSSVGRRERPCMSEEMVR